jgi:hypothetical protein
MVASDEAGKADGLPVNGLAAIVAMLTQRVDLSPHIDVKVGNLEPAVGLSNQIVRMSSSPASQNGYDAPAPLQVFLGQSNDRWHLHLLSQACDQRYSR